MLPLLPNCLREVVMKVELEKAGRYSFPMGVMDIAVRQDDQFLYAACLDGIYAMELPSREAKEVTVKPQCLGRHTSFVSGVGLLENDLRLATTSYDGTLEIRSLEPATGSPTETLFRDRIHSFWSWRMAVSRKEQKSVRFRGSIWLAVRNMLRCQAMNQR